MRARMVVRLGINFRFGGGTFQSLSARPAPGSAIAKPLGGGRSHPSLIAIVSPAWN